jgi:hypothetical protein
MHEFVSNSIFQEEDVHDADFIVHVVLAVEIDDEAADNNQVVDTFDIISDVSNGFYNKRFSSSNVDEG